MRKLIEKMKSLVRDDEGATMVEYAILVALISVAAITIITVVGGQVDTAFQRVSAELP